jgi:sugar/nucleoside kinase (ribokinase family)
MNTPELRQQTASRLAASSDGIKQLTAFVGLDGFVDEIIHVVDKRENANSFTRLPTIAKFAERLAAAAGKSTNVELVNHMTKLGGNGPIMANALASFGIKVTYLGNLGYPNLHPIFSDFAKRAEVHSIAEPGHTDAVEFDDGKIMMGKLESLKEVNWQNISLRYGKEKFAAKFASADLVGFVNWTMLSAMSEIWAAIQSEICPSLGGRRRQIFFDLADPEKRQKKDIERALELIHGFEKNFDVILGLNEKEAYEIGAVLGFDTSDRLPEGLAKLAAQIQNHLGINTLVVHPVAFALAVSDGKVSTVQGPFTPKPRITTGAGDHFNSGFCLGKLLGLDNAASVLIGVSTSGHYVRTGQSPTVADLSNLMQNWPTKDA